MCKFVKHGTVRQRVLDGRCCLIDTVFGEDISDEKVKQWRSCDLKLCTVAGL